MEESLKLTETNSMIIRKQIYSFLTVTKKALKY